MTSTRSEDREPVTITLTWEQGDYLYEAAGDGAMGWTGEEGERVDEALTILHGVLYPDLAPRP